MGSGSCTALTLAISRGRESVVKLLLAYGANPHLSDGEGSALHSAASLKTTNIAEILLELGVNPNEVTDSYYSSQGYTLEQVSPIHIAITSRNPLAMVKLLVSYGADINLKVRDIWTDGMEVFGTTEYDAREFYLSTLEPETQEKYIKEFNKAVKEGLEIRHSMLNGYKDSNYEESDTSDETFDTGEHKVKKAKLSDPKDDSSPTSSDEKSDSSSTSPEIIQDNSNKNQRADSFKTTNKNDTNQHTEKKTSNDQATKSTSSLIDLIIDFKWIENLPLFVQNLIKHSTIYGEWIKHMEQITAIYDKTINIQVLFNKKIQVDFNFKHDKIDGYSEYSLMNNIEEKLVVRQNTSTNEPFDTSMILDDNLVPYSILPADIGIAAFHDISRNIPVLGFNADFHNQEIVA